MEQGSSKVGVAALAPGRCSPRSRGAIRTAGPLRILTAGIGVLAILALVSSPPALASGSPSRGAPSVTKLPHSILGDVVFAPPQNATGVSVSQTVIVQTSSPDAVLQSVTLTASDGSEVTGTLQPHEFQSGGDLQPDTSYSVVATEQVPTSTAVGSPAGAGPDLEAQISAFSTESTPKVVSVSPQAVGPGQSTVVTFDSPASAVAVQGPVTPTFSAGSNTLSLAPINYAKGAGFVVTVTASNDNGTPGAPQVVTFEAQGGPGVSTLVVGGSTNIGVGMPVAITLAQAPADPAAFAAAFTATSNVTPTVSAHDLDPAVPALTSVATGAGVCGGYASPVVYSDVIPLAAKWLSSTKLDLTAATPDGYWPADATVTVTGPASTFSSVKGTNYAGNVSTTFSTGDKRVIDVDLNTQTLVACRNGVQVNTFPISSGKPGKVTADGHFYIYDRLINATMTSGGSPSSPDYYLVHNVPFTQYFNGGDALHGAWWHNNFGHPMSHGCINVSTHQFNRGWPHAPEDAGWLWNFDNYGDPVIIRGTTP